MQKIIQGIKEALDSKILLKILKIVGIVIVVVLVFYAGVTVGFYKASFGRAWGEHYNENFGIGPREGSLMGIDKTGIMNHFPNAHGATGKIIKIEPPDIIVQDKSNMEKAILIGNDTEIQQGKTELQEGDLKIDDFVVVIGTPDDKGVIEAKFIRLIPSPEFLK